MGFDLFASWADRATRIEDLSDDHVKIKYLLTRDKSDAKKIHQGLIKNIKFKDMSSFIPSSSILHSLPRFSVFIQFEISLATPFLSKDDEQFHICDNPVRKDKVFKVPMISGSGWKGNMRWTARRVSGLNSDGDDSPEIIRLFGNSKGEDKRFNRGRLNFFSTFFDKIDLEVINPHDRRTKAGTLPIYIESVPAGSSGTFSLLYVPFDLIGKEQIETEVAEDLRLTEETLRATMLTYGFSAKKGDGFGIICDELKGVTLKMNGVATEEKKELFKEPKKALKSFAELVPAKPESESGNFDTLSRKFKALITEMQSRP